jgi:CheY-like chemotaxis protein
MNPPIANGKSILYIEDDLVLLTAYRKHLQLAGFEVESSVDGIEAMRILAVRVFDIIILDLMLPRFSGEDVLRAIRSNPRLKNIPVIIFSSNMNEAATSVLALADRYLLKGNCSIQKLLQAIEDLPATGQENAGLKSDAI